MLKKKNKVNIHGSRIVAAMSGGVDSSLCAALLKDSGFEMIGLTFRMWPKEECGSSQEKACCSLEAVARARAAAKTIGIPYYVIDLSEDFKKEVIDYFCAEYLEGRTPNPCVICNEKIKFGRLLKKASALGASHVATGHYANVKYDKLRDRYLLMEGADKAKDQSYFLFTLSQKQLKMAVFPLGKMTKDGVRRLAKKKKLNSFNTASSQDICFVRGKDYGEYIRKKMGAEPKPGNIVDINGSLLGRHRGLIFYTIGQRRGLGIARKEPLYVTGLDVVRNTVIAGSREEVMKNSLTARRLNWISIPRITKPIKIMARIRYNHKKAKALVTPTGGDSVRVDFKIPQFAPTPGQAVVFYDDDVVVGGGWIE